MSWLRSKPFAANNVQNENSPPSPRKSQPIPGTCCEPAEAEKPVVPHKHDAAHTDECFVPKCSGTFAIDRSALNQREASQKPTEDQHYDDRPTMPMGKRHALARMMIRESARKTA
ncbi:MAG: hypothetical protein FWD57_03555 [Polyangiaceae bacterium]|nr:hypothetical protein [Polyangiaceae bacterium]